MAKDVITEYDSTANNNTVCGDVNIAENSALPSDMNNFAREIMSHLKEGLGSGTPLYVDQTNNRVGINKTPTVALDVSGDADLSGTLDVTGTVTAGGLTVEGSTAPTINIKSTDAVVVADDVVGAITFEESDATGGTGVQAFVKAIANDSGNTYDMSIGVGGNTEAIRIDQSGNVGIGTSSPSYQLHVSRFGAQFGTFETTSTTADVGINLVDGNSNNYTMGFDYSTGLLKLVRGTMSSTTGLSINSSGNVGIGTSSPASDGKLTIHGTDTDSGILLSRSSGNDVAIHNIGGTLAFRTGGESTTLGGLTERMRIDISGNLLVGRTDNPSGISNGIYVTGAYTYTTGSSANMFINSEGRMMRSTSSLRYKNTINDATHGLTELLTLRPVTYKGNNDGDTIYGGLIAEEVHDAGLTEFVQYNDDGEPDALAYGNMVSLCIKAIQELKAELDSAKARITALENGV